jgi:hypothetical protein
MSVRHLVPAVFLMILLLLLPASFMNVYAKEFLVAIMCVYLLAGFCFSLRVITGDNWDVILVQPFATFCFHIAYGAGTLWGLVYLFQQPSTVPMRPGLPIREKAK